MGDNGHPNHAEPDDHIAIVRREPIRWPREAPSSMRSLRLACVLAGVMMEAQTLVSELCEPGPPITPGVAARCKGLTNAIARAKTVLEEG